MAKKSPRCPVTGEPPKRLVQWVNANLLVELWRRGVNVDVRPSFRGATRFGLWESPTGLYFFHPMRAGDEGFYTAFYKRLKLADYAGPDWMRGEFLLAARHVRDGDRVLDVGCGFGPFRHAVPHARYTGLDPHFDGPSGTEGFVKQTLEEHLRKNSGRYDVVCAFQVVEHVENPVAMVANMMWAVKPGGLVIVGVPHVPAAHTRIPNYLINATPHHLTWWTEAALKALALRAGLREATVEVAPWSSVDGIVYWMSRMSPVKCRDAHFRHAWSWHGSALFGLLAGYVAWKLKPTPRPRDDEGASLLLVARRA